MAAKPVHTTPKMKAHEYTREGRAIQTNWASLLTEGVELPSKRLIPEASDYYDCFCLHNLFSTEECQRLIEAMEKGQFKKTNFPQKYRGNLRLQTFDEGLAVALWERMQDFVPDTIIDDEGQTWEKKDLNTKWRCSKYYPPTRFQEHVDASYFKDAQNVSFYTVNIYLNDNFSGGATRLYHSENGNRMEVAVQPEPGMALIFRQPPTELLSHDGAEVTSGIKYLLRTDVMYQSLDD